MLGTLVGKGVYSQERGKTDFPILKILLLEERFGDLEILPVNVPHVVLNLPYGYLLSKGLWILNLCRN